MDEEPEAEAGGGAAWMATFADMMTLLLTFFVLLLSFATMDKVKFQDALGSVQEALGVRWEHPGRFEAVATAPIQIFDLEATPAVVLEDQALLDELEQGIAAEDLENEIDVEMTGRGVLVRVSGRVLYQQSQATLRVEGQPMLRRIGDLARGSDHDIMIEGHTDDVPIQTRQFPSNWELSTARAIAAMRFLVDQGVDSDRIGVAGYAERRPLQPNDSDENRALNRRVEFMFTREGPDEAAANAADDIEVDVDIAPDLVTARLP
jgi:chemotaxis protein MotB